ncbi:uncharacterized protein F4812DRAFT_40413 [Daldinia caldariorum]|uniref:uncharacterized protein n=1 Tax=Daldinia caldariorum TaxID=326644 RepID=UPI0020079A99|nr:uncharacterized protein F4812DRAFT_40413 [Daldinia caldariorum]KAI1473134.1 hypothetical protein F4812DRAFT_40413 [Daldinia caldariorum]
MPQFLIPARNSRHRTACFALYRALLRQAPLIPLPDDLASSRGPVNPVKHLVRRAFRRNTSITSPRLIYPALKAGYQILALLKSATSSSLESSNADHSSILSFLRERLEERSRSLAAKAAHAPYSRTPRPPSTRPRPDAEPLLVNVTPAPTPQNPNPRPVYATPSRPRPLEELGGSGRRRVPHIDLASDIPFLRIKKPQPAFLSHILRNRIKKRVQRLELVQAFHEWDIPSAELEDEWEKMMGTMLLKHARSAREKRKWNRGDMDDGRGDDALLDMELAEAEAIQSDYRNHDTFRQTVYVQGIMYTQEALNRDREDQVARAEAMRKLIMEEAKLAEQEKAERDANRRKRWEEKMQELHGEMWRQLFPDLDKEDGLST